MGVYGPPDFFEVNFKGDAVEKSEITGGCLCGAIRYRAVGTPMHQALCHCGNCRRAAGAQSVAWVTFKTDQVEFVQGERSQYKSETQATWSFCGTCGTTLSYENDRRPGDIDLTVGSLDDPELFPPNRQTFEDEKLSWV